MKWPSLIIFPIIPKKDSGASIEVYAEQKSLMLKV